MAIRIARRRIARRRIARRGGAPVDADERGLRRRRVEDGEVERRDEGAARVVHVDLAVERAEQDVAAVGRPAHVGEPRLELLPPQPVAVDRADDHHPVLVDDADALAVGRPPHPAHRRLVPVVDHLLEPHPLVQHPHDDQPVLVGRRELAVVLVPAHAHRRALVALERLVHREVRRRGAPLALVRRLLARVELEHLEQPALAAAHDPAVHRVPVERGEADAIGNCDLLGQVDEHGSRPGHTLTGCPESRRRAPESAARSEPNCLKSADAARVAERRSHFSAGRARSPIVRGAAFGRVCSAAAGASSTS